MDQIKRIEEDCNEKIKKIDENYNEKLTIQKNEYFFFPGLFL